PPGSPRSWLRDRGRARDAFDRFQRARSAPRDRPARATERGVGPRPGEAGDAPGGALRRERVPEGRVAERGRLRHTRSRMAWGHVVTDDRSSFMQTGRTAPALETCDYRRAPS